jgi:hypothetical protein
MDQKKTAPREGWGTSGVVHDNCYDYAFGSFSNKRTAKSVPGNRSGMGSNGLTFTTCKGIVQRVLSDNPSYAVYQLKNPNANPKPGFYKVMAFVAPHNDFGNSTGDFHWYKQISGIRYRTRPGDTVETLARFFSRDQKNNYGCVQGVYTSKGCHRWKGGQ